MGWDEIDGVMNMYIVYLNHITLDILAPLLYLYMGKKIQKSYSYNLLNYTRGPNRRYIGRLLL